CSQWAARPASAADVVGEAAIRSGIGPENGRSAGQRRATVVRAAEAAQSFVVNRPGGGELGRRQAPRGNNRPAGYRRATPGQVNLRIRRGAEVLEAHTSRPDRKRHGAGTVRGRMRGPVVDRERVADAKTHAVAAAGIERPG